MDCDPEWAGLPVQQALEKAFSLRETQFIQVIEDARVVTNYQKRPVGESVLGVWVGDGVVKGTNARPVGRHSVVVLHHQLLGDVDIDEEIADIVKAVWDRGVVTVSCCQDHGLDHPPGIDITVTIETFSTFLGIMRQCMGPQARRWHATFRNVDKPGTMPPNLTSVVQCLIPLDVVAKMRDYLGCSVKTGAR